MWRCHLNYNKPKLCVLRKWLVVQRRQGLTGFWHWLVSLWLKQSLKEVTHRYEKYKNLSFLYLYCNYWKYEENYWPAILTFFIVREGETTFKSAIFRNAVADVMNKMGHKGVIWHQLSVKALSDLLFPAQKDTYGSKLLILSTVTFLLVPWLLLSITSALTVLACLLSWQTALLGY